MKKKREEYFAPFIPIFSENHTKFQKNNKITTFGL
jgi:hypothetical protein